MTRAWFWTEALYVAVVVRSREHGGETWPRHASIYYVHARCLAWRFWRVDHDKPGDTEKYIAPSVILDPDPLRHLALLGAHDLMIGEAGPIPVVNRRYHEMLRGIYESRNLLDKPIPGRAIVWSSPLTRLPVTMVYNLDGNGDVALSPAATQPDAVTVAADVSSAPEPGITLSTADDQVVAAPARSVDPNLGTER